MTDTLDQQRVARIVLALAFAALGLWIVEGFVRAVLWGAIIAIAVAPLAARAEARLPGRRTLLAGGFTLAIALLIVVPLVLGVVQAAMEAHQLADWLAQVRRDGIPLPAFAAKLPVGRDAVATWWQATLASPDAASGSLDRISVAARDHSRLLGAGLLRRVVAFTFALLTLFFLLRDRTSIAIQARIAGERLFGAAGERVAEQILLSVRGTINGLVLVGIGEGVVMALIYLAGGVPHPVLLGLLTGVSAAIPLGAAVVIVIAGLLLLATGATIPALVVTAVGLVFVVVVDHTIRPALIGGTTRLPFLLVLIGILGGVETLGLIGLFVGPAVMAVLVMLWRELVSAPPRDARSEPSAPSPTTRA